MTVNAAAADSRAAEAASAFLPPLLVAAERVALAVAGGVHGRRRPGQGDSFWEYRPIRHGEAALRVDWRRSARLGRAFVRETEWEAAQTVALWRDDGPRMQWRSANTLPRRIERTDLLLLAVAALLLRGGERPRLLGAGGLDGPATGAGALPRLAERLEGATGGVPLLDAVPTHSAAVLFSDFLAPVEHTEALLAAAAGRAVRGVLVQVLDPAEIRLPFRGRVRFRGVAGEGEVLAPRAERLQDAYARRLAAHDAALRALAAAAGFGFVRHSTDAKPEVGLAAIHAALRGDRVEEGGAVGTGTGGEQPGPRDAVIRDPGIRDTGIDNTRIDDAGGRTTRA